MLHAWVPQKNTYAISLVHPVKGKRWRSMYKPRKGACIRSAGWGYRQSGESVSGFCPETNSLDMTLQGI